MANKSAIRVEYGHFDMGMGHFSIEVTSREGCCKSVRVSFSHGSHRVTDETVLPTIESLEDLISILKEELK